ncbi:hypothetical protein PV08_07357 [Exophiala spinifera]|uniref:NAD(P)-binding protein n=1 Tax=Exophiala spinifera TaxID=91928 RepID=A0A0D2B6R6_9EURO|nr:uncharacterized protein PV08_07357 [Exophiala spinifera]KIW14573.1 hypothetical protein PV08_07357 [Exophiala spinifera]
MSGNDILFKTCALVGAGTLASLGLGLLSAVRYQLHRSTLHRYRHGKEPWVLVTGASDGIGLAFAHQFAQSGFNVILHGRTEAKLKRIQAEFEQKYSDRIFKIFVLDATTPPGPEFDRAVLDAVKDLRLTALVHNAAGSGGSQVEANVIEDVTSREIEGWINVNVRFMSHLTRLLLPILLQNQPGLLIFMSSAAADFTTPNFGLYTGAKAFVEGFSRVLALEMKVKGHDLEVKTISTGMVATASSGWSEKDISFSRPSTTDFVKSTLKTIGYNSVKVTPYIGHRLQFAFFNSLPSWAQEKMVMSSGQKVRDKMAKRN